MSKAELFESFEQYKTSAFESENLLQNIRRELSTLSIILNKKSFVLAEKKILLDKLNQIQSCLHITKKQSIEWYQQFNPETSAALKAGYNAIHMMDEDLNEAVDTVKTMLHAIVNTIEFPEPARKKLLANLRSIQSRTQECMDQFFSIHGKGYKKICNEMSALVERKSECIDAISELLQYKSPKALKAIDAVKVRATNSDSGMGLRYFSLPVVHNKLNKHSTSDEVFISNLDIRLKEYHKAIENSVMVVKIQSGLNTPLGNIEQLVLTLHPYDSERESWVISMCHDLKASIALAAKNIHALKGKLEQLDLATKAFKAGFVHQYEGSQNTGEQQSILNQYKEHARTFHNQLSAS